MELLGWGGAVGRGDECALCWMESDAALTMPSLTALRAPVS